MSKQLLLSMVLSFIIVPSVAAQSCPAGFDFLRCDGADVLACMKYSEPAQMTNVYCPSGYYCNNHQQACTTCVCTDWQPITGCGGDSGQGLACAPTERYYTRYCPGSPWGACANETLGCYDAAECHTSPTPPPITPTPAPQVFGTFYKPDGTAPACNSTNFAVSLNNTSPRPMIDCINNQASYLFSNFSGTSGYTHSNYQLYYYQPTYPTASFYVTWTCSSNFANQCSAPSGFGDLAALNVTNFQPTAKTRIDFYIHPMQYATVNLQVRFQGISSLPPNPTWTATVTLNTDYPNITFTSDGTGLYTGSIPNVPYGTYPNIKIKTTSHLRKDLGSATISANPITIIKSTNNTIKVGDFTSDNHLTIADVNAIVSAFTTLRVSAAGSAFDVTRDNRLDLTDVTLVLANFTDFTIPGD